MNVSTAHLNLYTLYLFCAFFIFQNHSLHFYLKANSQKCIRDHASKNVIVHGLYNISAVHERWTTFTVRDYNQQTLYQNHDLNNGKFTFNIENDEPFTACFESKAKSGYEIEQEIFVDFKHGTEAKDFDMLAKAEKLKPIEVELKKLEGLADEIVQDFYKLHAKSSSLRSINQSTHTRVLYLSIFSMVILVGFACWQIFYLRRYFKSRKLID